MYHCACRTKTVFSISIWLKELPITYRLLAKTARVLFNVTEVLLELRVGHVR